MDTDTVMIVCGCVFGVVIVVVVVVLIRDVTKGCSCPKKSQQQPQQATINIRNVPTVSMDVEKFDEFEDNENSTNEVPLGRYSTKLEYVYVGGIRQLQTVQVWDSDPWEYL